MVEYNRVGFDTGVFARLAEGDATTADILSEITTREVPVFVSAVCVFELIKLRHRGVVDAVVGDQMVRGIPEAYTVLWIDALDLIRDAAGISHGNGLSMADALILSSYIKVGCDVVVTTDSDLKRYEGKDCTILQV